MKASLLPKWTLIAAPLTLASGALAALAGDSAEGKRLLETNCLGCHDTGIYVRPTRSVRSLDELKQQLETCGHALKKELSSTDRQNVIKYLNDQYYRFP